MFYFDDTAVHYITSNIIDKKIPKIPQGSCSI